MGSQDWQCGTRRKRTQLSSLIKCTRPTTAIARARRVVLLLVSGHAHRSEIEALAENTRMRKLKCFSGWCWWTLAGGRVGGCPQADSTQDGQKFTVYVVEVWCGDKRLAVTHRRYSEFHEMRKKVCDLVFQQFLQCQKHEVRFFY